MRRPLGLRKLRRSDATRPGGRVGIVIRNVQYNGLAFPVDEITARIGEQFGLHPERLVVARYRGNSAQQMATYGRKPARESVVILQRPGLPAAKNDRALPGSSPALPPLFAAARAYVAGLGQT